MLKKKHFHQSISLQLKDRDVVLLLYGARAFQEDPDLKFSPNARWCMAMDMPLLTYHGAKIYKLRGGWWKISGYGYEERSRNFDCTIRVDVRDDLRTIGFAV